MKKFDLEAAKNGAAVCLSDGTPVYILDFDFNGRIVFKRKFIDTNGSELYELAHCDKEGNGLMQHSLTGRDKEFDLFMAPVYAYMNVFKSEDGIRLHGGTLYPTPEDCVKRAKRTWNASPFCIARVELLDVPIITNEL